MSAPPPKRAAGLASSSPTKPAIAPSFWERTKSVSVGGWNQLYAVADKVGGYSNAQTAKLGMEAFFPTSLDLEAAKAARILRTFTLDAVDQPQEALVDVRKTQKIIKKIPPSAIEECFGLAIFTVCRTGFVISGAGGSGIVIAKTENGWSPPSGILLHTLGVGLMFGGDIYDVVLILRTKAALDAFLKPRVSIGGEVSVAVGPYGSGAMLEAGIEMSPVWSYTKSKGLYGGVQIDGNVMIERVDENARAYLRPGIKAKEILNGETAAPYWCRGLHQTLLAAEGKSYDSLAIVAGNSPSSFDTPPALYGASRRLPPELEDADDREARLEMELAMREFGIDDTGVNASNRELDEQMISGEELAMLEAARREEEEMEEVPILSPGDGSVASSDYPISLEEKEEKVVVVAPPPPLPVRRSVPPVPISIPTTPVLSESIALPVMEEKVEVKEEEVEVKAHEPVAVEAEEVAEAETATPVEEKKDEEVEKKEKDEKVESVAVASTE